MSSGLLGALTEIVGPTHCLVGAARAPYVVDGRTPYAVVRPGSREETARVVAAAAAAGVPVMPWGGGTEMGLGAPPREGALVVTTGRLDRVVAHEPGDLTATVEAGITVAALQAALGVRGQWVSLDPPAPDRATLGGVLATNAAGPRRHLYGTARDLVLGLTVVGADGALVRAGGKVVKNVAGYDLVKLHLGALGTLGLIVEATLKLRPRPESERACWAIFGDLGAAGAAVRALLGSDLLPHAVELVNPAAARLVMGAAGCPGPAGAGLLVGFDGLATTVAWQVDQATGLLRAAGARAVDALPDAPAAAALAAVADLRAAVPEPRAVARVGVLPAGLAGYLDAAERTVAAAGFGLVAAAHAGHGLGRLVLAADGSGGGTQATARVLGALREAASAAGGHLRVEWAPLAVKEDVAVWQAPGPAARLMRAIKARLDPAGVMNPGRFVDGL